MANFLRIALFYIYKIVNLRKQNFPYEGFTQTFGVTFYGFAFVFF
jgi:hypothetical protein